MKVFLIAGETSGDKLGAALMSGLKSLHDDIEFVGIAGPLMQAQGMQSLFPMDELSVMGLAEILPKYFHLKRRIAQAAQAVLDERADVLITIDSPDFCHRVAKIVKSKSDVRTIHYVAPTVWAWRPKRARKMARYIDHVLALLPFEPPYMTDAGMGCDFVGHPVVAEPKVTKTDIANFYKKHGFDTNRPLICVLPGSRKGEVTRLAGGFDEALTLAEIDHMQVVLPTLPHLVTSVHENFNINGWAASALISGQGLSPEQALHERRVAMAASDVALAASGTVSLELAAVGTPMVIAYDMSWLSRKIIKRMLRIDTVTLVNLVTDTRIVPEFIGEEFQPEPIAKAVEDAIANETQKAALELTMTRLGQGGEAPGLRAAKAVLAAL